MVSALAAAKAYAAVQKAASPLEDATAAASPGAAGGPSFAELVNNAIGSAIDSSKKAEVQMAAQARGKADLIDVVTAVSSAQTQLQTVMAIRDQVISAYKEVLALQI
jgi:flagellar hook-basal body complex protein FliE